MVVRVDPPNFATRVDILNALCKRGGVKLSEEVVGWIARRVTQNVRELEGAVCRIAALANLNGANLSGEAPDMKLVQAALGDLDRQMVAPVRPENIMQAVCNYFSLEHKDLMSGRRQRTISLARSVAMYLVRKTAKLSFPEIGNKMGKRNHSTVISACRRIEKAVAKNEPLSWTSSVGERRRRSGRIDSKAGRTQPGDDLNNRASRLCAGIVSLFSGCPEGTRVRPTKSAPSGQPLNEDLVDLDLTGIGSGYSSKVI